MLKDNGIDHEKEYLGRLRQEGKSVIEIPREGTLDSRINATLDALNLGVDVVYQAVLRDGCWCGTPHFLIKCDTPSSLGDYSYEVLDTKLTTKPELKHLTQPCGNSDMLSKLQGWLPHQVHIVTSNGRKYSFKVNDHISYYHHNKNRFERYFNKPPNKSSPKPCNLCNSCRWLTDCEKQWEQTDHLKLVHNIKETQRDNLRRAGITTVAQLATTTHEGVRGITDATFLKLKEQAYLQHHKKTSGKDKYIVRSDIRKYRGFARMPTPAVGDLFFDMESYPSSPDKLEYLFGVYYQDRNRQPVFKTFWAHDHSQEKEAFDQLLQFFKDHLEQYPGAYIYHYHLYEPQALSRLSARHESCLELTDDLFCAEVFVDLCAVVRESIRISEPRYSLKNLEKFYGFSRDSDVATAEESVAVYHEWLKTKNPSCLQKIADYNRQDCESTMQLRDWLLKIANNN